MPMDNAVGPVLRMGDTVDAVIEAIREDNPPARITDEGREQLRAIGFSM